MSDNPIIDDQAIAGLRDLSPDGDTAFLRELIEIYLQDVPSHLAEIEQAIAQQDAPQLTRAAHTIKGSSGNFGAGRLVEVAREMEIQGKASDFAAATTTLPTLKAEYELVQAALSKISAGT